MGEGNIGEAVREEMKELGDHGCGVVADPEIEQLRAQVLALEGFRDELLFVAESIVVELYQALLSARDKLDLVKRERGWK